MEIKLTRENYSREISDAGIALVDFQADWCVYCRRIAPAVRALAQEREDLRVLIADIDALPELAAEYGVEAVPTFLLLRGGEVLDRMTAPESKAALEAFVEGGRGR